VSTRTRTKTIWCVLLATTTIALVAAQVGLSSIARQAQTLLAPSFTAPRLRPVAPPTRELRLVPWGEPRRRSIRAGSPRTEFRASWFGRSADQLFTKLETMPPAAPAVARCRPETPRFWHTSCRRTSLSRQTSPCRRILKT
jgi:hypothetical protein